MTIDTDRRGAMPHVTARGERCFAFSCPRPPRFPANDASVLLAPSRGDRASDRFFSPGLADAVLIWVGSGAAFHFRDLGYHWTGFAVAVLIGVFLFYRLDQASNWREAVQVSAFPPAPEDK